METFFLSVDQGLNCLPTIKKGKTAFSKVKKHITPQQQ